MRAPRQFVAVGLILLAMFTLLGTSTAAQSDENATQQQGEIPTGSPTGEATADPCLAQGGEAGDSCASPTPTSTETVAEPTATASLTPTLEYEIDVPISFFPSETPIPANEETVAAVQTESARATQTAEASDSDVVTDLPNTGGGPSDSPIDRLLLIALAAVFASVVLASGFRSVGRL